MNAILLIGAQASGKSSFYHRQFSDTHVRINLDMLRTRRREMILVRACIEAKQPLVLDNTNTTRAERARYLPLLKEAGFSVTGYYFQSAIEACLQRNEQRPPPQRVPERGVRGTHARLELPALEEGFDALHYVRMDDCGGFVVEEWQP